VQPYQSHLGLAEPLNIEYYVKLVSRTCDVPFAIATVAALFVISTKKELIVPLSFLKNTDFENFSGISTLHPLSLSLVFLASP
jgi:hypothetical protein